MSPNLDRQALDLINAWEAGAYLHPAQKKAALQVAIRDALAQARAEGLRQAAEVARRWGDEQVKKWADDNEMCDDAKSRAWDVHVVARKIEALIPSRALAEGGE